MKLPALAGAAVLVAACVGGGPSTSIPPPIPLPNQDYRNGWYHFADGRQTIQQIADTYRRDPELVGQLNRFGVGERPPQGKPIYIPPVHDRAELRRILEQINRDPASVPQVAPSPEFFDGLPVFRAPRPAHPNVALDETGERRGAALTALARPETDTPERTPTLSEAARAGPAAEAAPGRFRWPVEGRVSRAFSAERRAPFNGVLIDAEIETPVRAARAGRVIYAGALRGYGRTVIVDHGDRFTTVYGYNERLLVRPDEDVESGQTIATVGRPSDNGRGGLFFQIRKDAAPVDPIPLLR